MSFLKIGDRAAGAIKSGGTTRRAAKMVVLNADHPDIGAFVDSKALEEAKAHPQRHALRAALTGGEIAQIARPARRSKFTATCWLIRISLIAVG